MNLDPCIDVDQFSAEINESLDDLTEAMRTQTARAAFYGIGHSKAKRQQQKVALIIKTVEAQLTKKHRKALNDAAIAEADATGTKPEKITVDMVKSEVALDNDMRKWALVQMEADEIETVCRVAYDAFKARREMLTSLGLLARDQLKTNMQITSARSAIDGYRARRAARREEEADQE